MNGRKPTPRTDAYADEFIGPREPHFLTLIPFPGFYDTCLSADIDYYQEQEAEHYAEKEIDQLEPAQLDADEFHELISMHMHYGKLHRSLARAWLDAFNNEASDAIGIPLGMKFESMDSPNYYNFETDRVFAHIPLRAARQVVRYCLRSKQSRQHLRDHINTRHSSRSGFMSWYSTDIREWAKRARDLMRGSAEYKGDMDHNHFQTFLEAAILSALPVGERMWVQFQEDVYDVYSQDGLYTEWDQSMDWSEFDAACAEKRAEKIAEWQRANPGQPLPPQPCPCTLDLFDETSP